MAKVITVLPLLLLLTSPAIGSNELSLSHKISIPEKHTDGRGTYHSTSVIERYVEAYERSWWSCVKDRAKDIDYKYTTMDISGNGWSSFIDGWKDGYLAANRKIDLLIKDHGKEEISRFLKKESKHFDKNDIKVEPVERETIDLAGAHLSPHSTLA